uniref:GntR family transcriptional regulator n=1 Tax=Dubosiella newyorkensis TaxID=1862672 RepID=UPI00272AFEAE
MEKLQSKKGGKALYVQIKEIYREKILNGDLKHGDKIESEMEIQKMFGTTSPGRSTAARGSAAMARADPPRRAT